MVIVLVIRKMLGQVVNSRRQQRDLYLRGPGIGCTAAVLIDDRRFLFCSKCHLSPKLQIN
jgi:hypothetical protein